MSPPQLEMSWPLAWVTGRPRTPAPDRKIALWRNEGRRLTLTNGQQRLRDQVAAMTPVRAHYRVQDIVLSTNIRFTASGARDRNVSRQDPEDPGVAFYFNLDRQPYALACDRWDTVADNIAAIAAHIEALRGQERWGVADLRQAFAGHIALPAPEQWWQVLGVQPTATAAEIQAAWRSLIAAAHPDRAGGSDHAAARINAARNEGLKNA